MAARRRHTDTLRIKGGLAAVPSCELEIRPFTVFIGPQGTGKSLVAQILYAFEELHFLLLRAIVERGNATWQSDRLFAWILDRLRSPDRRFGTFANPTVRVAWSSDSYPEWLVAPSAPLEFSAYAATHQLSVHGETKEYLDRLRPRVSRKSQVLHHAIFFPAERVVMSQLRSAMSEQLLSLPITYELFSYWLEQRAVPVMAGWKNGVPPGPDAKKIAAIGAEALGGSVRKYGDRWKWQLKTGRGKKQFDLDMASSGQRANWSIPFMASALLSMRGRGDVAKDLTLFVEEPEIHLHPEAQRGIVNVLALLVNRGFRVVVTTHSMTVLYALNNLMQAALLRSADGASVPPADFRISARDVSVYAFQAGEKPRQLCDREKSFIDERPLGWVNDELSAELNRIAVDLDSPGADA